jgi:hypothetical protein
MNDGAAEPIDDVKLVTIAGEGSGAVMGTEIAVGNATVQSNDKSSWLGTEKDELRGIGGREMNFAVGRRKIWMSIGSTKAVWPARRHRWQGKVTTVQARLQRAPEMDSQSSRHGSIPRYWLVQIKKC